MRGLAFFGGGTGGHLMPGIALAERAGERFPGCRAVFFRTARAVEDRAFGGRGVETVILAVGAPGRSAAGWLRYSFAAAAARKEIAGILRQGFDAAFGLGGYASFPGVLAARVAGVPVILLEQNRAAGRANRLLAPFADAVASSFGGVSFPFARRVEVTGNPVRRAVLAAASGRASRAPGSGKRRILVVGGSQGASALNRAVREALPALGEFRDGIEWSHVTGDADKEGMMEAYRTLGWDADVMAYTDDLPRRMAESDLVLARAGGTTLAEIAVIGTPSVLVPYPHHRDRHQWLNAEAFARAGGARILPEEELGIPSLRRLCAEVVSAPDLLQDMGRRASAIARPHASDLVLDLAVSLQNACRPLSGSSS